MDKLAVLKEYFGYTSFRQGQEELIDNILRGKDTLGIMPTGAGKSICYQVPALIFDGITLVVSPLISLMKDQVNSLIQSNISAAYINSSLSYNQYIKALQNAADNKYKIIYIAPERLSLDEFICFAKQVNISMVTIDEAHCVSQWGQDFRPSYLKISQFISKLSYRPVVSAFTATATLKVKDDIIEKLDLIAPHVLTTGFDRKNLYFSVLKPENKFLALKEYISENRVKSGIVYCSTRKTVEEVCSNLIKSGFNATRYHAGLSEQERSENQDLFIYDKCNIMVATNAFGMGIDKSNVSFVIHYNMPKNIESYYQEAGRAGRDGEDADCILLYGGQDVITNQFLIENTGVNEELDRQTNEAIKEKDRELLKIMTFYCHTNDCLREYILHYFGEKTTNYCGNCSSCNSNFEEADVTVEAQKILSCIKRSGERFGIKMIADILRGSRNHKLITSKLDKISTYGLLKGVSEDKIRDIINYLVLQDYIEITNSEFPVLKLNQSAAEVLLEGALVNMKVLKHYNDFTEADMKDKRQTKYAKTSKPLRKSRAFDRSEMPGNDELFERLRLLRSKIAANQKVPAYIVFSDATLKAMCVQLPANSSQLLKVSGIGQAKLEKYGKEFLEEISAFRNGD